MAIAGRRRFTQYRQAEKCQRLRREWEERWSDANADGGRAIQLAVTLALLLNGAVSAWQIHSLLRRPGSVWQKAALSLLVAIPVLGALLYLFITSSGPAARALRAEMPYGNEYPNSWPVNRAERGEQRRVRQLLRQKPRERKGQGTWSPLAPSGKLWAAVCILLMASANLAFVALQCASTGSFFCGRTTWGMRVSWLFTVSTSAALGVSALILAVRLLIGGRSRDTRPSRK